MQAKCYNNEKDRQTAFLDWWDGLPISRGGLKFVIPQQQSSPGTGTGSNDGELVIEVDGKQYVLCILEVKNEIGSSGDPMFQTLRYYQLWYRVSVSSMCEIRYLHAGARSLWRHVHRDS